MNYNPETIRIALLGITATLVIIGWFINNLQANTRETRKERRVYLDDIYRMLEELKDNVISHHTKDNFDARTCARVKSLLQNISVRSIHLRFVSEKELGYRIANLRKLITTKNFDSASSFKSWKTSDPRLAIIIAECDSLVAFYEAEFSERYHQPTLAERMLGKV